MLSSCSRPWCAVWGVLCIADTCVHVYSTGFQQHFVTTKKLPSVAAGQHHAQILMLGAAGGKC
jgi:hypothetical protein